MKHLSAACAALLLAAWSPAAAQELDLQLQEIRTLVREKRYPLALESLRLVARQIQDLRVAAIAPAFPEAPGGWSAAPPLSLLEEDEIWTDRIAAQRSYAAASGASRVDIVIDVHSPFAAATALSLNPLVLAADPEVRLVEVGGRPARLRFLTDAGEGELRFLAGDETLVSLHGRGIPGPQVLLDLAGRVDTAFLRLKSGL